MKVPGKPITSSKIVELTNYFIRDEESDSLIVFQLPKGRKIQYATFERRFGINPDRISEANKDFFNNIFGMKENTFDIPSVIQTPKYNNLIIVKDQDLMACVPKLAKLGMFFNPMKKRVVERFINTLSHPSVKTYQFDYEDESS